MDDFPVYPVVDVWTDTGTSGFGDKKVFVVQTNTTVIQRCMLMATDPGDLVLDPTCGGGTTAYVAEQWGRRWITVDTSRVALALARTRLMSARYPYYLMADTPEGQRKESQLSRPGRAAAQTGSDIRKGFVYERVPHVTLKSIAQNPDIHEGMSRADIDAAIARHAETETAVRPAVPGHQGRPGRGPLHGREPVAPPGRRRWPGGPGRAHRGRAHRGVGPVRGHDPRQPAQGGRPGA